MLIYAIDDDPDWQDYYATILGQDHDLRTFPNGVSAINAIDLCLPDAILLDLLLTGPSGISLLAELQSYADTARLPIAVITGVDTGDLSVYGVSKVFNKASMTPKELLSWISKHAP